MSGSESASFHEVQPGRALWLGETSCYFTSEVCRRCHGHELLLTEPAKHDDIGIVVASAGDGEFLAIP